MGLLVQEGGQTIESYQSGQSGNRVVPHEWRSDERVCWSWSTTEIGADVQEQRQQLVKVLAPQLLPPRIHLSTWKNVGESNEIILDATITDAEVETQCAKQLARFYANRDVEQRLRYPRTRITHGNNVRLDLVAIKD